MTRSDHQLEADSSEPLAPMSATAMFLNAFQQQAVAVDATQTESLPVAPSPETARPPTGSIPAEPSEFTRLFQNAQAPQAPENAETQRPSTPAAGEFTRICVPPPLATLELPKINSQAMPRSELVPKPARGFSSPGTSDSAAGAGDFTQLFRSSSPSQASAEDLRTVTPTISAAHGSPEPVVGNSFTQIFRELSSPPSQNRPLQVTAQASPPSTSSEPTGTDSTSLFASTSAAGSPASVSQDYPSRSPLSDMRESQPLTDFRDGGMPPDSSIKSQSATEMFSSVPANDRMQPEFRSQSSHDYGAPLPQASSLHSTPSAHPPMEPGSLTQLIDMLSPVAPRSTPGSWSPPPAPRVGMPPSGANPGPGEITTIISGDNIKATWGPSVRPAVHSPIESEKAAARIPGGALPGLQAKLATPPGTVPKPLAAPASAMSKLQEMLPILLVLNAFLMLVLIVVIIFAVRQR